jgi:hypothetical protein
MQRGVIQITKNELQEIYVHTNLELYEGKPLKAKLIAAGNSTTEPINIEVSEDEVEAILDNIIIPSEKDNEFTLTLKKKLQDKMGEFRALLD